ncbi:MAG: amidohydrolase [Candidimonas sp.]|nr:MAG: amidohydrolase [Candidimonas sp.]
MKTHPIISTIHAYLDDLVAIRHDLHAHPELAFQETRTSDLVAEKLAAWGCEVHRPVGRTGLVGVLKGDEGRSGRSLGLRADMDALPIMETTGVDYASTNEGVMHACGHDGHTTVLLGAARYLARTRHFDGTVNFIFQPAEEGRGGAKAMVEDGLFERFPCDAVYALHNSPDIPPGVIGVRAGPTLAAADFFDIHVQGHGGHGAHPYQTSDPVVIAGQLITALQSIVSRNVPPLESAVVTIAAVKAGNLEGRNVIPNDAYLSGTVRTFTEAVQERVIARMRHLVDGIGSAFDAKIGLDYHKVYPATVNVRAHAELVADVAAGLLGEDRVIRDVHPAMGAEDFSFMLRERPGAYFRLGQGGVAEGRVLHSSKFDFNDAVIPTGSAMFCQLVETVLKRA